VSDGQIDVCRYDVYVVGFHCQAIRSLTDRDDGGSRQNLGQHAVVVWIEMLNEYDGKARVARQEAQQALENLQSPRRRADSDHRNDSPSGSVEFGCS
jgi:hypothetical protein